MYKTHETDLYLNTFVLLKKKKKKKIENKTEKVHCGFIINIVYFQIFVFNPCSLLFCKRFFFIFDVLRLYSIVKAQQNLPNYICALLGLMRVFMAELAYRGRRGECLEGTMWSVYGGDGLG